MQVGALWQGRDGCLFRLFAPLAERVRVKFPDKDGGARDLRRKARGYWELRAGDIRPGDLYLFQLDDGEFRPDPASRYQPRGVHGPSQVFDHTAFSWTDSGWKGPALSDCILYEIHAGAFTEAGSLAAIASELPHLQALGINALEIMPVNQFPGTRNWGYDGAYLYAVQNSYGGPDSLKRLVDACHNVGMAVVLDVVYNHLGPEGNYLHEFGPYFTDHYRTPWGRAINFDQAWSDQVRDFFIENAMYWFREFHIDGLRLDAVHQMYDMSAMHFLAELEQRTTEFGEKDGHPRYLIAESDLNDPGILASRDAGGYGMDAQWLDDFQHCVDSLLRGKDSGYARDFGSADQLTQAYREGFVYAGEYCPTRRRRYGASSALRPPSEFIAFIQNHDQVGNRPHGERFNSVVDAESYKLAAGAMFLSPYIPLLFMGEEYGETNPFQFFADYGDPELARAVREGRKQEFAFLHDSRELPDPISVETFRRSRLDWSRLDQEPHRTTLRFYREMIGLRKSLPALARLDRAGMEMNAEGLCFRLRRRCLGTGDVGTGEISAVMNFGTATARTTLPAAEGDWLLVMDSADAQWGGPGTQAPRMAGPGTALEVAPRSFVVFKLAGEVRISP